MMLELTFSKVELTDIAPVVELINAAYRGESSRQGWTTEADLLDGLRTDTEQIQALLAQPDSMLLCCKTAQQLLGSVHMQYYARQVEIGLFAVLPGLQGRGIGKQLLAAAESIARQNWPVQRFVMSVIPGRLELIAFYQRRGYSRTGVSKPFPVNPALWQPKVEGLRLEKLEKPA